MTNLALRMHGVSKCHHIYETPAARLLQFIAPGLRRLCGLPAKSYFREFWALREISFTLRRGETVGIIGRNGAGKSTLLQILCGTLSPSSGSVEVNGRIAALLELGAGFNPEFTGRENVYLNAGVWGLRRDEIDARFTDIVAFADIGDFIEQPVKTYSSGMFVRLAFAIAVHVEPEILIVDEALSVGDIAFQNKCIERIKHLRRQGTTLLFVSHDMSTLQMICDRVIWIEQGRIKADGDPVAVCQEYYVSMIPQTALAPGELPEFLPQQRTGMAEFTDFSLAQSGAGASAAPGFMAGDKLSFRFSAKALQPLGRIVMALSVYRSDGDWIVGQTSLASDVFWPPAENNASFSGNITLEPLSLAPGEYRAACGAFSEDLSLCYAMTEVNLSFSVRARFPNWGKIIHPCKWIPFVSPSADTPGT